MKAAPLRDADAKAGAEVPAWSSLAGGVAALLVVVSVCAAPLGSAYAGQLWTDGPDSARKVDTLPDFVDLAAKLGPAVVNISSKQAESPEAPSEGSGGEGSHGELGPFHEFGPPERFGGRSRSLGSGFVINRDGYILTNDHVVENSSEIVVTTREGAEFKAKLIGRDTKTDVALLKIDARHDWPVAPLGNSDRVKVGEWVMAIGNPYGFDHTVTAGIVSAKGRFIPRNYDDFIQTDASINPGNSGGPLIDLHGEVVGVNAAIFTHTGSSMGIGFAIPINLVKDEIDQLKSSGKVVRGWLGILVQKVTPDIAEAMGLGDPRGALVADVLKDGPAKAAGIQRGDVIIAFNSQPVSDSQQLPLLVGHTPLGKTATVTIIRNKATRDLSVTITPSREAEMVASAEAGSERGAKSSLGLFVKDLSPQLARDLGLGDKSGVVISSVEPSSPADSAGLRARDVIIEVNRQPVKDVASYAQALNAGGKDKIVLLFVKREDTRLYVAVKPQG
jgi:serine protease Do